ncbi:hypothetical protein AAG906_023632 [Vitis piasezkii]
MASKHDIGWEHAKPIGGSRRTMKCKYCGKVIHGEGRQEHQKGASSSQSSNARIKHGLTRSFSEREGASIPPKGIDPYMFPSKQKSIKSLFSTECVKKVGTTISKFFLFNVIPFNAAGSGPYYESMIDTIVEASSSIKGPMGYQIGNTYLEKDVQELEVYITTLKAKWPIYGCIITCDGWSSRTRKPIINFMIYSHCIDLMLEDIASMKQIEETLDQAKMIIGFIYNSLKVVNLMKVFNKDKDLLRLGITRFATEFISLESLIRYEADLKRMCTTNEWREFNKDRSRKSLRDKPTLSIIYEAMDRTKLYWEVIDRRWEAQLQDICIRRTSNATQERNVDSCHKGKAPRTISSSSSSNDGDNGRNRRVVALVRAVEELVALVRILEEIVALGAVIGHDYHRSNYHCIDEHLQNLGIGSRLYFRGVDDRSYHNFRDRDSSSSTFSRNDFDRFPMMHPKGYSNTGTRASDSYGYDQSSSSSSIAYRGFGYYQYGVDPEQPLKPYFPDYGSSSQSS